VIQYVTKKVARDLVNFMVKNSTKIEGTEWEKELKLSKNKNFYNWIDEITQKHYKNMNWT